MSSLTPKEKGCFERLLRMESGYIANFSDASIGRLFNDFDIDIHSDEYISKGTSKANKLRSFWEIGSDAIVGKVMGAMIDIEEKDTQSNFLWQPSAKQLEKKSQINECKIIVSRLQSGVVNLNYIKSNAIQFDATHLAEQISRIENSIDHDPSLAIGTAKELIETCCKTILKERGIQVSTSADIPTLTKETLKELKLVPEGVPNASRGSDTVKRVLQNLGQIGNNLAELRGLYGTGHGKEGQHSGLASRHAKLAVGASVTLATFLFETHQETKEKS